MKKSKKGVTLVELVICCAITVMLAGACTAVLISGQRVWKSGSESANAQMTADVIQTSLYGKLPSYNAGKVVRNTGDPNDVIYREVVEATTGVSLYMDDSGLVIRTNGKNMNVDGVTDFTYTFLQTGSNADKARAQFNYTATLEDGRTFSGGIVVSNLKFKAVSVPSVTPPLDITVPVNLEDYPLHFDSVTIDPDAGE